MVHTNSEPGLVADGVLAAVWSGGLDELRLQHFEVDGSGGSLCRIEQCLQVAAYGSGIDCRLVGRGVHSPYPWGLGGRDVHSIRVVVVVGGTVVVGAAVVVGEPGVGTVVGGGSTVGG